MRKAVAHIKRFPGASRSSRTGSEAGHRSSACERRREGLTAPSCCSLPEGRMDGRMDRTEVMWVPWPRTGTHSPLSSFARKTHLCRARTELALARGSDAAEGPPCQICQQKMQCLLSFWKLHAKPFSCQRVKLPWNPNPEQSIQIWL